MRKLSQIMSALLAITASGQLYAEQVQGSVINSAGKAVANATVKVMGTNNWVTTNQQGAFSLTVQPGHYELHVVAKNFVHKNVDIDVVNNKNTPN